MTIFINFVFFGVNVDLKKSGLDYKYINVFVM